MDKDKFNFLISNTIRSVRIELHMTQSEVAILMNMDTQNFSKYERGLISPTVFWVKKYCDAIGYDFNDFMTKLYRSFIESGSGT